MQGIINWKKIDELPEESDYYLVADGESYAIAYFVKGLNTWSVTSFFWKSEDIKYWTKFQKLNLDSNG